VQDRITPDRSTRDVYESTYARYRQLYEDLCPMFERG
jgi:hypothetical protein